jgi:hypothetical protein
VFAAVQAPTGTLAATLFHPSLTLAILSGIPYMFQYRIPWRTGAGTSGLRIGLTFPAVIAMSARVEIPVDADGVGSGFQGIINASGDSVIGTSGAAGGATDQYCIIDGSIYCSGSGVMNVFYAPEAATASGIRILAGACGIIWAFL